MENNITNIRYINTETSPSHLVNNLTTSDKFIYFIHNSETLPRIMVVDKNILKDSDSENYSKYVNKFNSNETNEMLVVKCVNLKGTYYMAVGLYGGFKLLSIDGSRLLFQIPTKVKTNDKPYAFTAITEYGDSSIISVDNYGQLFNISGSGVNWRSKLIYSKDGGTCTAVCSSPGTQHICVGYENGEVFIFKHINEAQTEVVAKLDSLTYLPCLSMAVMESEINILACCYLNGEVMLHNLSDFQLLSSFGAHIRMITNIIAYKDCFITCGDDCFVNIWKIDNQNNLKVIGNYELSDKMPIGVAINNENNGKVDLIVTMFDNTVLGLIENLII